MFAKSILILYFITCSIYATRRSNRIIGGDEAPEHKYPFMASLRVRGQHFCAGSLINERWLLSAAHCFHSVGVDDGISAVLGSNQIHNIWGGETFKVVQIVAHSDFDLDRGYKNDIALLKLDNDVKYSENIKPVQISTDTLPINFTVKIIGWGNTEPNTTTISISNNLKELVQVAKELNTCSKTYAYLYKTQLCIWSPIGGTGSCVGDSGGPLITSSGTQVGILSMGTQPCALDHPTIYTDVSQYISWINEEMSKFAS